MKKNLLLPLLLCVLAFAGCDKNGKSGSATIQMKNEAELNQTLYAEEAQSQVTFVAEAPWTASAQGTKAVSSSEGWFEIYPLSGEAGTMVLSITLDPNYTGVVRTVSITLQCNDTQVTITVNQSPTRQDGSVPTQAKLVTGIARQSVWHSTQQDYFCKFVYAEAHRVKETMEFEIKDGNKVRTGGYVFTAQASDKEMKIGRWISRRWDDKLQRQIEYYFYFNAILSEQGYVTRLVPEQGAGSLLWEYTGDLVKNMLCNNGFSINRTDYTWSSDQLVSSRDFNETDNKWQDAIPYTYGNVSNTLSNIDLNPLSMYMPGLWLEKEQIDVRNLAMIGLMGKRSTNLLTEGHSVSFDPDPQPNDPRYLYKYEVKPLEYEFDDAGYVTKITQRIDCKKYTVAVPSGDMVPVDQYPNYEIYTVNYNK